jgi:hypothetical protein
MKRYDPITYRHPRTLAEAFGDHQGPIEMPLEPSLLKWWADVSGALAIVGTCILILKVMA